LQRGANPAGDILGRLDLLGPDVDDADHEVVVRAFRKRSPLSVTGSGRRTGPVTRGAGVRVR
jgi:hypothetical protein